MKKITIIVSLFVVSAMFLIYSCSKEDNLQQKTEVTTEDQNLEQQIIDFKNMLNSIEKSGEKIDFEEAIWYLDAIPNYSYTFPYIEYNYYSKSSSLITMEVFDNSVDFTELVNIYSKIEDVLRKHYFEIDNENKHLSTISVIKTENCTENTIELMVYSSVGIYSTVKTAKGINADPFGTTDYWHYMKDWGKCNGFTGGIDSEAGGEIASEVNNLLRSSTSSYYTDPEYRDIWPWDCPNNDPLTNNEYMWLLFEGDNMDCFTPDDMNFYYSGLVFISNEYKPLGKDFKSSDLIEQIAQKSGAVHQAIIWYGIRHDRIKFPEDLHE